MPKVHKKEAAAKILADEGSKKHGSHAIKQHLMQGALSPSKGITKPALEKRTTNRMTSTVTAFTKPAGLVKAVKIAMNSTGYVPGTAQKIPVTLTAHRSTGKLPSAMQATQGGPTRKVAVTQAMVEFRPGGKLKTVFPIHATTRPVTARTTPKPAAKSPGQTLQQIADRKAK